MRSYRRAALALLLATPVAGGIVGCSSTGAKNPFAAAAQKNKTVAKTAPKPEQGKSAGAVADAGAAKGAKSRQFDQETLALIERELRDTSPDERDALYNELKSVPPEMVREVLRIRRLGLNFREQQRLAERSTNSAGATDSPAGEIALADAAGRRTTDPGLGESPWSIEARRIAPTSGLGGHSSPQIASAPASGTQHPQGVISAPPPPGSQAVPPTNPASATTPPPAGEHAVASAPVAPIPTTTPATPDAGVPAIAPAGGQTPAAPPPIAGAPGAPIPGTTPQAAPPAEGRPLETAPLPQLANTPGDLVPGQYGHGSPLPGGFGQPVVANVQKAWQEIPKPKLPWGQASPNAAATQPAAGQPAVLQTAATQSGSLKMSPGTSTALSQAISELEVEVGRMKPGTTPEEMRTFIEKHVHLRLLYLVTGQQERSVQAIPGIPPADQEFWQQTLWGMSNYFDTAHLPREADRATQTVAQMAVAISRLKQKAALEVRNLGFCQRINSFGSYERFERDEYTAGQPVLLYAEIENFHSEPTSDGQHRTLLKSTLEIYRPGKNGELIDRHEFPATEDLCRNPRRDYFHSYEFTIPTKLALGPHVLKLTVEDQLTRRVVSQSTRFTVK